MVHGSLIYISLPPSNSRPACRKGPIIGDKLSWYSLYKARLKPAPESVKRTKDRIRQITGRRARGRNIQRVIKDLNTYLRGWGTYFQLSEIKQPFETLDQWIRRRLRKLLWRQWKKPKTRYKKMVRLGVKQERAKNAAAGGRGPWYNAGASHMYAAVPNCLLQEWGLLSLLQMNRRTSVLPS